MRAAQDVRPFDVCGPLPQGVTVLEASAGTGKTFAIAALAARYVAEGVPLHELLLVTFTRMATGELRERVRDRLVSAEEGLRRAAAGAPPPEGDEVLRLLAAGPPEEIERRRRRLEDALSDFDAATIATTHQFCEHVLSGLGVIGDVERDVTFMEDVSDLVDEVVDDLYVRRFHRDGAPPITRGEAIEIARAVVANPFAPLEPRNAPEGTPAMRRRLAEAVRRELEARKRRAGILTYDDLLSRLRDALAHPERGEAACERLRARYRVALVDEFQDTDPVQWEIMWRAFGRGGATLVLIGDPKQAIYAFRGADVYAYLAAARTAGARATLTTNWRSDEGLIEAYDALFSGAKLGHEGIAYRPVQAAPPNRRPRLRNAPRPAPLRVRVLHGADGHAALTPRGFVNVATGRAAVARDLAGDLVRLLSSGAEVLDEGRWQPVRPGHVAVLVRTNRTAADVRDALEEAGVPAVINGAGSVFATPAAEEWLRLLEALERPASQTRAASAALTPFLGWSAARAAAADEAEWEEVHARLHRWADLLRRRGVASLVEAVTRAERLPGRLLATADGERRLTDLRHVGQLLHAAAATEQLGISALTAWFRERIAEAARDTDREDRSRRLESDAEAVQVLTIHRSKGLEFPVVYCPYLWDLGYPDGDAAIAVYHDPDAGDERTIDVGGPGGPAFREHLEQHLREERGEELRLLYVALTRARHQAVIWWASSWDGRNSALTRLLFARDEHDNIAPEGGYPPEDEAVVALLEELARRTPGRIAVERVDGGAGAVWQPPARPAEELAAAEFRRSLDARWRRTSYSAITAEAHEPAVASEPEEPVLGDEPEGPVPAPPAAAAGGEEERLRGIPSLLDDAPAGAAFGTLVHRAFERADFTAPDLESELAARLIEAGGEPGEGLARLVTGLRAAIETPLGPLAGEIRLRDVAPADRVDEMAFELPLAGGDAPAGELAVADLAALLAGLLPPGDPLAGYAERLRDPLVQRELRGYLAGSLDLVVRLRDGAGGARFLVIDHKTNRLAGPEEPLTLWHYRPRALEREMLRAHYGLQALLYAVALHRYLRWRLPGYDAERNLGGVLYLFLRGMAGPQTPRVSGAPCGVFAWRPPGALVEAVSDLLDRGRAAA